MKENRAPSSGSVACTVQHVGSAMYIPSSQSFLTAVLILSRSVMVMEMAMRHHRGACSGALPIFLLGCDRRQSRLLSAGIERMTRSRSWNACVCTACERSAFWDEPQWRRSCSRQRMQEATRLSACGTAFAARRALTRRSVLPRGDWFSCLWCEHRCSGYVPSRRVHAVISIHPSVLRVSCRRGTS